MYALESLNQKGHGTKTYCQNLRFQIPNEQGSDCSKKEGGYIGIETGRNWSKLGTDSLGAAG